MTLASFDDVRAAGARYDVGIAVKAAPPPAVAALFDHVLVDVVDADAFAGGGVDRHDVRDFPRGASVVVQNPAHAKAWCGARALGRSGGRAFVVEHLAPLMNATSLPAAAEPAGDLRVLTIHEKSRFSKDLCAMAGDVPGVAYDCEERVHERVNGSRAGDAAFFARKLGVDAASVARDLAGTVWGEAYWYSRLFRNYDAVLVYSKTGPKKLFNCVQRMANAMRAGVAAVVERTGAHALYVDEGYPCQFRDAPELRALLARLAARPRLLAECRDRGLALVEARFSPAAIARKYAALLGALADEPPEAGLPAPGSPPKPRPPRTAGNGTKIPRAKRPPPRRNATPASRRARARAGASSGTVVGRRDDHASPRREAALEGARAGAEDRKSVV